MNEEQQIIEAIKAGNADKVRDLIESDIFLADARAEDGTSALLLALYHGEEEIADIILESGPTLTIHEAAAAGVDERVEELVRKQPHLMNSVSHDGWTPLHLAVYFNQNGIAEFLLTKGADPNVVSSNKMGVSPLHSALANRNGRLARLLLTNGADLHAQNLEGYTPLHYAAANGMREITQLLLARGADYNAVTATGKTPLDLANENSQHPIVVILEQRINAGDNAE